MLESLVSRSKVFQLYFVVLCIESFHLESRFVLIKLLWGRSLVLCTSTLSIIYLSGWFVLFFFQIYLKIQCLNAFRKFLENLLVDLCSHKKFLRFLEKNSSSSKIKFNHQPFEKLFNINQTDKQTSIPTTSLDNPKTEPQIERREKEFAAYWSEFTACSSRLSIWIRNTYLCIIKYLDSIPEASIASACTESQKKGIHFLNLNIFLYRKIDLREREKLSWQIYYVVGCSRHGHILNFISHLQQLNNVPSSEEFFSFPRDTTYILNSLLHFILFDTTLELHIALLLSAQRNLKVLYDGE